MAGYGLIHIPLHLRVLNHYTLACILKYFKFAKTADDHLPDTLSSKLPPSVIALVNSEVRSVIQIDSDRYPPFSNACMTHCLAPRHLMGLLSAKIAIDRMDKFAKLSSTKLISLLIRQTLISPNFHRLR